MAKLLGIDIGTSATKAILIDETGQTLKSATSEYPLSTPQPNWAEQNPLDWQKALFECISQIGERKLDAIGITGQMHGMVALDARDEPVRPAILWCDQRTSTECAFIDEVLGAELVRETTCNAPMNGFQAPKILWMKKNEPKNFARTKSILLPKDFARFLLTGEKATDVTDASGTGLLDVKNRTWWVNAIDKLELDFGLFSEVQESSTIVAQTIDSEFLAAGIPVVAGAGDQAAGAVGTGAISPDEMSISLGTSGVVFASIENPAYDPSGSINVFCHANRSWHAMGVMLSCGGAIKWARDSFFSGASFAEFDSLAVKVPIGCDGLTFLPYLSGERCPHNDPNIKGALSGLSLGHSRAHIARSIIEGVTFGLRDCFELMGRSNLVRVTGGGAQSSFWMQMIADVCEVETVRIQSNEGPAFGAAILAGVGIGIWSDVQSASKAVVRSAEHYQTCKTDYTEAYKRYKNLYPLLKVWNSESIALQ